MKFTRSLVVLTAAVLTVPAVFAQGPAASLYGSKCAMCHGADGKAATPVAKMMGVPSFDSAASKKQTNAALTAIVEDGKGKMPAYKSQLSGTQVKELVAYIRTLQKK
ncbi:MULTISPECIES: cytochrome c [Acidobacterium]|uniref:Cytochrome c family protein n=1 Tax=Acidobacterium capsulatum (strain ATCC 51196 / DSM 11244 / BCRC 80197 / JCM 7670 / NBRC 15755 / NCIMB 13165 / 161) TaxID=240015 RepID=C1F0X8_ACIC5|nr:MULTISPECIES: cytochrome c [Acidobacterium]ACO31634.1 cytochrome c family protein [Acidobacterium capsulatum ATCC 51196]HCT61983.1 cytochrome c [Acidobacterium sp.]